jgi:uncharacterized membrane protein
VVPPVPTVVYFSDIYTNVLLPRCLACHSAPHDAGHVNLENYANFIVAKDEVHAAIASGAMPPRKPLTDDQKKLILDWIEAGAKEKADTGTTTPPVVTPPPVVNPPPTDGPIYFADVLKNVIGPRCLSCHSSDGIGGYADYSAVKEDLEKIKNAVESDEMPADGGPLTPEQKAMLLKWIADGGVEKAP